MCIILYLQSIIQLHYSSTLRSIILLIVIHPHLRGVLCKRWYCMKNQDEKITIMITDNTLPVEFVKDIGRPASKFFINGIDVCGRSDEFCTVHNGCYHMKHNDAISKRVTQSRSQSAPAAVSP
mmetsp:Transcript_5029/g.4945  ORF Transcript_5029/g.4945 Transcript_5029/m.4945 type:complete len:123 (-) Transcript_5029:68-436(-)